MIEETIGPFIVTKIDQTNSAKGKEPTSLGKIEIFEQNSKSVYSFCFINSYLLKNIETRSQIEIKKFMIVKLLEHTPKFICFMFMCFLMGCKKIKN